MTDWGAYFNKIKTVCPWSYGAWHQNKIEIVEWNGDWHPLGDLEARVYTLALNRRRLKLLCKKLDESQDYEWLWSEPRYGKYASPVPILIQQDRKRLNEIRISLKKHGSNTKNINNNTLI